MKRLFLFIIIASWLAGCSSIFYYPTHENYLERAKYPLKPESISIPSSDGVILHAWLIRSKVKARGLIVHFHGNAQNLSSHFYFLRDAGLHGYDHFIFDYRGYGESTGKPSPKGLVDDGIAALKWAGEHAEGSPLIVFAQSLGGAVAMRSLEEMKDKPPIQLLVLDSTFANYRSEARQVVRQSWITWILQPIAWLIVDNSEAPVGRLSTLPTPILVIHGDKDRTVPISLGRDLFKNLPEPKEMWEIPGGTHTDFLYRPEYARQFYSRLDKVTSK